MKNTTKNYDLMSSLYDNMFKVLVPGHQEAAELIHEANIQEILEVGIGSGLTLEHYSPEIKIIGIDTSKKMLAKAQEKVEKLPKLKVELKEMDATHLDFPDASFCACYAPSLLSVVTDPVKVIKEMARVTKKGGKIFIICHFQEDHILDSLLTKLTDPLTRKILGFRMDLKLSLFDKISEVEILNIKKVNPLGPYHLSHFVILEKK